MKTKNKSLSFNNPVDRRKFMSTMTKAVGSAMFLTTPLERSAKNLFQGNQSWTVGQIIDLFINAVPGAPFETTVDTLKSGSRDIKVTGIVTTMFATLEVIQKAIALKANFIIAHEPTFYNHLDDTSWLEKDEVYRFKADLLKKHNIAVWRNHDYIHRLTSDGVRTGVVAQLKWEKYFNPDNTNVFEMPAMTLNALIGQVKERLNIPTVRYIGDPTQSCKKILLMPGASGGRNQITSIGMEKPDVVLCGEIQEWETAEYVRDALTKGQKISLVVLGHVASEEPGSEFLATWLKEKVKGVTTTHVPAGNSLLFA
jgi:putative NIF3 family GTP cyclohydrolase 1 type 2